MDQGAYSDLRTPIQGRPIEDLWVMKPLIEMTDPAELVRLGIEATFDTERQLVGCIFHNNWLEYQMILSLSKVNKVRVTYFNSMYVISTLAGRDLVIYPPRGKFLDKDGKVTDVPPPGWIV